MERTGEYRIRYKLHAIHYYAQEIILHTYDMDTIIQLYKVSELMH